MKKRRFPSRRNESGVPIVVKPRELEEAELREQNPALWPAYEVFRDSGQLPGSTALMFALMRKVSLLNEALQSELGARRSGLPEPSDDWRFWGVLLRANRLSEEVSELLGWLQRPLNEAQRELIRSKSKPRRGRRTEAKNLWLKAWNLRLLAPRKWTWAKLPDAACSYHHAGQRHDPQCRERIRQGVIKAEKLAAKYGVLELAKEFALRARTENRR